MSYFCRHRAVRHSLIICAMVVLWALCGAPPASEARISFYAQVRAKQPTAKKHRKRPSAARPLPIPVPSRSDALSADTLRNDYRLEVFTDVGSERGAVRVTLRESQPVEIVAFNILGKRVVEVYSGEAKAGMNTLSVDLSGLSNGVYICVVRGRNFKTAEKFIVSR